MYGPYNTNINHSKYWRNGYMRTYRNLELKTAQFWLSNACFSHFGNLKVLTGTSTCLARATTCLARGLEPISHGFVMVITRAHANKRATPNFARHVRIEYYFKYLKKIKVFTLMEINFLQIPTLKLARECL